MNTFVYIIMANIVAVFSTVLVLFTVTTYGEKSHRNQVAYFGGVSTMEGSRESFNEYVIRQEKLKSHQNCSIVPVNDRPERKLIRNRRKIINRLGHYYISRKNSDGSSRSYDSSSSYSQNNGASSYAVGGNSRGNIGRKHFGDNKERPIGGKSSGRGGNRRGRNRKASRRLISQKLKMEIGEYALEKGPTLASEKYERKVGRKLRERIIEKFARRFRTREERRGGKKG